MNEYWSVYVIETDKHTQNNWDQTTVYVGMTKYSPEERFLQHQNGIRPYMSRYGKPIQLVKKYCVQNIPNEELANDIERLIWHKLKTSRAHKTVQRYAPSMQSRGSYLDNYQNYTPRKQDKL